MTDAYVHAVEPTKGIVLVADDAPEALTMLNECLVKEGYTVLVAMDGLQVLAIANRMQPDIILLDAMMPNMDGFEACRKLKIDTELRDVPVIFMTGLSDSEHVLMGLEAGGVDYVNKPVDLDELLARIKVHISNSRMTRSARSALEEIGQLAFACNIHGHMLWSTVGARKTFNEAIMNDVSKNEAFKIKDSDRNKADDWLAKNLPKQLHHWLSKNPPKNSVLTLIDLDVPLTVRYLGQPNPGEFLLRLVGDEESNARAAIRREFGLTEREAEVLFWLSRGKTNREIAQILSMSPRTVNKHLEPVYKKLGVENRTAAIAACMRYLNN